ncbi:uncharacterized protein LOC124338098 isoform X1 [Daphnia pulicaria]|nr:uncharacterized protein LOC124338098 isoform X1 [Daphnia pulicaria]
MEEFEHPDVDVPANISLAHQSLFKAEKMTEPLKPPASAAAYYFMTHHSELDNLTPAEIDVLWGKVPKKQKKKCIEEHKKKRKDYVVYEIEKFVRALSPAELKYFHTITKNRARDQEDEVKESSDEESSSSNEEQTSGACWDDEESEEELSNSNEGQTSVACWDDEASETSKKTVKREEDVDSDEDLEIPPKTTFQKPNSSLEMYCNSYMDKYSKHPKLTKQDLKSTLATNQSLFKAEKMTEPLQIPSSATAYYVMTHHSKLDNLTPAEIDVLWGKVSDKQKKTCIEEHKKKRKDYVYEFEKFLRALSPAELRSYHTITKNLSRDQEDDVKESSDDEFESISTDEDQTSVACSDHDGQNILGQD